MSWWIHVFRRQLTNGALICWLLVLVGATSAPAGELTLRWSRDQVHWAEPVTLEISVRNPDRRALEGGITVSFSSQVLVLDQSPGAQVYFQGSRIMQVGHASTMRSRDVMVETWFRAWPPGAHRTVWITFFPVRSGLLTVKVRAAWIRSRAARSVVNVPRRPGCIDQQGYPAICRHVRIHESPDTLASLRAALGERLAWDRRTYEHLQRLLLRPWDAAALDHFGIELSPGSRRLLEQYAPVLREKLRDPRVRDHPHLLSRLLRLMRDPMDAGTLRFLGFVPAVVEPEDPEEIYISEVKGYLSDRQGGTNLLSLIAAEGDVAFGYSTVPGLIVLEHDGRRHLFRRGPDVVAEMIEGLVRIKPSSKYIRHKEEVSGYSYLEVLKILRKE